jgi:hypothetical protein
MDVSTLRPLMVAYTRLAATGRSDPSDQIRPTIHLLTGRNAGG